MVSKAFAAWRETERRGPGGDAGRGSRAGRPPGLRRGRPPARRLPGRPRAARPRPRWRGPRWFPARSPLARSPGIRRGLGARPGKHLLKSDLLLQQLSDSGRSWHADSWNAPASKAVEMKEKGWGGVKRERGSRLQPRLEPDQGCLSMGRGGARGTRIGSASCPSPHPPRAAGRGRGGAGRGPRAIICHFPFWVEGRCPHKVREDAWALDFWVPEVPRDSLERGKWWVPQSPSPPVCAVDTQRPLAGFAGGNGPASLHSWRRAVTFRAGTERGRAASRGRGLEGWLDGRIDGWTDVFFPPVGQAGVPSDSLNQYNWSQ